MKPPPIPAYRSLDYRIFYGTSGRGFSLAGSKVLIERIESCHQQARDWLRQQSGIEVISIVPASAASGDTANATYVTVWYRQAGSSST